ncbi:Ankyrin repeat containing protein [Gracilaria domingensis]|nr:Ankyrin repeat containing protein [Gracilaria domingensis]
MSDAESDAEALCDAARRNDMQRISQLLASGVDVNDKDAGGHSPLLWATMEGSLQAVQKLLSAGADPNVTSLQGSTALMFAVSHNRPDIVAELLRVGAMVNLCSSNGNTALHRAARQSRSRIVEMLWKAGGDPLKKNHRGETALSLMSDDELARRMRQSPRFTSAAASQNTPKRPLSAPHTAELDNNIPVPRKRVKSDSEAQPVPVKNLDDPELHLRNADQAKALRHRFAALLHESKVDTGTVTAQDAVAELKHALAERLRREGGNASFSEHDVAVVVDMYMDPTTGRLRQSEFVRAFFHLRRIHPVSNERVVREELGKRFRSATNSDAELLQILAKSLLHTVFLQCGGQSISILRFRRTKEEWNESEVDKLLKQHGSKIQGASLINEEGFIEVGMKVLFKDESQVEES